MARRIEKFSNGNRTVGYDPNPRGLAGTNTNNRRLAGTSAIASDYKRAKKQKQDAKQEKEQGNTQPPYTGDGYIPNHNGIWYNSEYDDQGINDNYQTEKVVLGEGVQNTDGEGWILKLHFEKSDVEKMLNRTLDSDDATGLLTGSGKSMLYIRDVSSKSQVKLPTSPLENGMVKHDHKVVQPKTLRISGLVERGRSLVMNGLLEYAAIHKSLKVYFELTSPWKDFKKMYLSGHTSKASNKMYDMYEYSLDLTEILIASDLKDTTDDAELASNTGKGAASAK